MQSTWNQTALNIMIDQDRYFRDLGERLAALRRDAGMTQTQLGKTVGLSQQMIAEYEAGTRKHIPLCRLIDMAEVLGVGVDDLVNVSNGQKRKRGPAPKVQQLVERIYRLPSSRQKFVTAMIENALQVQ